MAVIIMGRVKGEGTGQREVVKQTTALHALKRRGGGKKAIVSQNCHVPHPHPQSQLGTVAGY